MNYDKDTYKGYVEMALGVGDMAGPAIGSFVYEYSGFAGTFIVFGVMILIGIIFSIIMIPNTLNNRNSDSSISSSEEESESVGSQKSLDNSTGSSEYKELTYSDFFRNT